MVETISYGEKRSGFIGDTENCDNCGGRLFKDLERGQYVCRQCGTVMDYPILSPELTSNFCDSRNNSWSYATVIHNSGPPTTIAFHDLGISSEIGGGFRDAKGKALVGKARYRAILLRKWHSRTRTKSSRDLNVAKALTVINDLAGRLGLPLYVREEACLIYRKVAEKRLTIGRSIFAFASVSLYAAIRRAKLPLLLRDVLPVLQVNFSESNACLNIMKSEAGIEVPPHDPVSWISKIAAECGFSYQTQLLAAKYIRDVSKTGETFGMLPHIIAAIALYRMGATNGEKRKISLVAKVAKCATTSIQKGLVSESEASRAHTKSIAAYSADGMEERRREQTPNYLQSTSCPKSLETICRS